MRKHFLLFGLLITILFAACTKTSFNPTKQSSVDDAKIQAYMAANNITATRASSGIYYQIVKPGDGVTPNDTSHVQVSYSGKLLNGTVFQPLSTDVVALSTTIVGWQDGLPLISNGGRIRLIIPSSLGYGTSDSGSVPANSVLDFTIDLLGFY